MPVRVVDAYGQAGFGIRACDGSEHVVPGFGAVVLQAEGPVTDPLTIPVTVSGPPASALVDPPDVALIDADGVSVLGLDLSRVQTGTLTLTFAPGEGYELERPTVEVDFAPPRTEIDCTAPLESPTADQTVPLGATPRPFGLLGPGSEPGAGALGSYDTVVDGALPPGLTYADDSWAGAASTPGTYRFAVRLCEDPADAVGVPADEGDGRAAARRAAGRADDGPVCFGTLAAEITVAAPGGPPAGPSPAPPAAPISGPARFTG